MSKWREKQVVEAFLWTGGPDQPEDPEWIVSALKAGRITIFTPKGEIGCFMFIHTHAGRDIHVPPGNYIVMDSAGKLFSYPQDIFESVHEPVEQIHVLKQQIHVLRHAVDKLAAMCEEYGHTFKLSFRTKEEWTAWAMEPGTYPPEQTKDHEKEIAPDKNGSIGLAFDKLSARCAVLERALIVVIEHAEELCGDLCHHFDTNNFHCGTELRHHKDAIQNSVLVNSVNKG